MKCKKIILSFVFLVFLVGALSMTSSKDQSFTISYNPYVGGSYETIVDFSSFLMKFTTENNSVCKYSLDSGVSYSDMEEVFDETGSKLHKKNFLDKGDGLYNYYVKCKNALFFGEPAEFNVSVRVNSLVTAQIVLGKSAPLNEGPVDLTLITSKYISQSPSLTYSFDEVTYYPLTLTGSGNTWSGVLLIDKSLEEGHVSFKFSANDLEGREGTEITVGDYFSFDTVKPQLVSDVELIGQEGEIELSWHSLDDDVDFYRIYRSEFSNPSYVDFYKEVDSDEFVDTIVESGQTYYYRISAVDSAGNEGDLSKEYSSTALIEGTSSDLSSSGLNSQLISKVDSLLVEVDSVVSTVGSISSSISLKSEKERELFEKLLLYEEISDSQNELNSLKNSVVLLKSQDLSEEDLDSKLDTFELRLGIIKKGVPEDLIILEENSNSYEILSSEQEKALFKLNPSLSERQLDKSIKETSNILKENPLEVQNFFYGVRVIYLDSSKKEYSVVKRVLSSELTLMEDSYFVENFPENLVSSQSLVEVANRNYEFLDDELVITFDTDTKEIFYSFPLVSRFEDLNNIGFSFVKLSSEDESSGLTGFSIFESNGAGKIGGIGALALILIFGVVLYLRQGSYSDEYFRLSNKVGDAKDSLSSDNIGEAKKIYKAIKISYSELESSEKSKLHPKISALYDDILICDIEKDLEKYSSTKGDDLALEIGKKINLLSEDKKKKVSPTFEKVKKSFENGE